MNNFMRLKNTGDYQTYLIRSLKNKREATAYLNATIDEWDPDIFAMALNNVIEALGNSVLPRRKKFSAHDVKNFLNEPLHHPVTTLLKKMGITPKVTVEFENDLFKKAA